MVDISTNSRAQPTYGVRPDGVAHDPGNSDPVDIYVPVTLGSGNLPDGACNAINAETAGRVNLKQPNGTARANYPLTAGYNPIGALMIDAPSSGTAATGVWALYS